MLQDPSPSGRYWVRADRYSYGNWLSSKRLALVRRDGDRNFAAREKFHYFHLQSDVALKSLVLLKRCQFQDTDIHSATGKRTGKYLRGGID